MQTIISVSNELDWRTYSLVNYESIFEEKTFSFLENVLIIENKK